MASDNDIATALRALAESADSEIATHDCRTLADALGEDIEYTSFVLAAGGELSRAWNTEGVREYVGPTSRGLIAPSGTVGAENIKKQWAHSEGENVYAYDTDTLQEMWRDGERS